MSTFECSCVSTVLVDTRPRSQSEDLHCRHGAVEDVHFFGALRVVSRRTFLDLEDCQIVDAAESCDTRQAVDTIESCDKKQRWSDEDSQCDTASDIDFEDLDTEVDASSPSTASDIDFEDLSSEDESFPSTTAPFGPPGVFVMALPAASVDLTDAFGFQTPCTDMTDAFGFRKPPVVLTDAAKLQVQEVAAADSGGGGATDEPRTTLILKNIPKHFTSASLARRLDLEGFAGKYDFVYVPLDLRLGACFGYAFVNMALAEDGAAFLKIFRGAKGWTDDQELEVDWSVGQGLAMHTEKYRNSPLMHEAVAVEAKPLLFKNGVSVPFAKPTKIIKKPRRPKRDA